MKREDFRSAGKNAALYPGSGRELPLVVLNCFEGDGSSELRALKALQEKTDPAEEELCFHLLALHIPDWRKDMTPWPAPPLTPGETPFGGGADDFLGDLAAVIIPEARARLSEPPSRIFIAGYSLAGLFALYALYRSDMFFGAAAVSGSFWFPGFLEYAREHEFRRRPERLYFSLGDREGRTSHKLLSTVPENTAVLIRHYRSLGIPALWEENPGNHFKNPSGRTARGIRALLEQDPWSGSSPDFGSVSVCAANS
ncbi:MAG: alpha/beta hydrolase [Succinimonas sp.]|nr:alpha/beta hydrolase [Succinimonas sp.]